MPNAVHSLSIAVWGAKVDAMDYYIVWGDWPRVGLDPITKGL